MAYTFKKVLEGTKIGKSLYDEEGAKIVEGIMNVSRSRGVNIHLPCDFRIGEKFVETTPAKIVTDKEGIPPDWMGLDIGPQSEVKFCGVISRASTVIWNGPMGVFEFPNFVHGTNSVMEALVQITRSGATTIIGGGDSAAYAVQSGNCEKVSHVSTGGGATLEFLEGKTMPGCLSLSDSNPLKDDRAKL
eukprot:TRINITY_DN3482_c0_g1_i9.p2 TRINITY_DN3482_c0_g1~~TRINITY_DN3482_c0_g1_i9.p2  ORF type:complete len:189 (-),score=50.81 TRINITY_DN3482_c0_g1_i9:394-960(-)